MPREASRKAEPNFADPDCREFRFSPSRIEAACRAVANGAAPTDASGRAQWRDTEQPGLCLRVGRSGAANFILYLKVGGRPLRKTIGPVDAVGLPEARAAASRLRFDTTTAAQLAPRKRKDQTIATLASVWDRYIVEAEEGTFRVKRRLRPNTIRVYRGVWEASLANHGRRPLSWVADNLETIHRPLQASAPIAANRALALLSILFRFASQRGLWNAPNPIAEAIRANRIARTEERPRQRFLSDAERARFLAACDAAAAPWGDLFRFAFETGLRKSSLLALRWRDVRAVRRNGRFIADGAALVVPAEAMKGGRSDHAVDLRSEAVAALERRYRDRKENDDSPVFSWPDGSPVTSSPYERAFHAIIQAAGLSGLRPHDLRRDLGARLVAAGTPLPIVARCLGHAPASIAMLAQTYAPVSDATARQWMLSLPSVEPAKPASTPRRNTPTR